MLRYESEEPEGKKKVPLIRVSNMPLRISDNPSFRRQISLDQLAWDPRLAATLTRDERRRVLRACSAILSALAAGTEAGPPARNDGDSNVDDELLTPEQAAQRLGIKLGTLYERLAPLDESHGVIRVGRKCTRIRWQLFWAKLQAREIVWRRVTARNQM